MFDVEYLSPLPGFMHFNAPYTCAVGYLPAATTVAKTFCLIVLYVER